MTDVSSQPATVPELPAVLPLRQCCSPDKGEKKQQKNDSQRDPLTESQLRMETCGHPL